MHLDGHSRRHPDFALGPIGASWCRWVKSSPARVASPARRMPTSPILTDVNALTVNCDTKVSFRSSTSRVSSGKAARICAGDEIGQFLAVGFGQCPRFQGRPVLAQRVGGGPRGPFAMAVLTPTAPKRTLSVRDRRCAVDRRNMDTEPQIPYLQMPADDRFEARLPRQLKQDAEKVARAYGQSLAQLVVRALAEKVTAEYALTQSWQLTPPETAELLRILAQPAVATSSLLQARREAEALFGQNPT